MDEYLRKRLVDADQYENAVEEAQVLLRKLSLDVDLPKLVKLGSLRGAIQHFGYVPSADAGETGAFHPDIVKRQIAVIDEYLAAAHVVRYPPDLKNPPVKKSGTSSIAVLAAIIVVMLALIGLAAVING